jgi:hypothetical protein
MKRFAAAGFVALLLIALAALVALSSRGGAASAAQYQYGGRPSLTLSTIDVSSYYIVRLTGVNYFAGSQPGGQLVLSCGGRRGASCGPTPDPWPAGPVDTSGRFSFDFAFACGSNVRSVQAVGNDGVKSSPVRGLC